MQVKLSPVDHRIEATQRLIKFVRDFHNVHGPVPMKVLAAQFAKTLNVAGSFIGIVDELRRDGTVLIMISKTGARLVAPGTEGETIPPEGYRMLKHD